MSAEREVRVIDTGNRQAGKAWLDFTRVSIQNEMVTGNPAILAGLHGGQEEE